MSVDLPPLAAKTVVVFGDVMEDIIVRAEGALVKGSDRLAKIAIHAGGSGANQAAWLAASGVPVRFVARVAKADVDRLSASFDAMGVTPFLAGDPQASTGRLVTLVDPDGERSFLTDRGANLECSPQDLPAQLLEGVGLVVVSGYAFFASKPRETAMALIKAAAAKGLPVLVDAASVGFLRDLGQDRFFQAAAGAFGLFANVDEAAFLSGETTPEAQVGALTARFELVVVKAGAQGSFAAFDGGAQVHCPALAARVVDTTGAGDAFLAGFVGAWQEGGKLAAALAAGNRRGAEAVSLTGGRPPAAS